MTLLKDDELLPLATGTNPIVSGLPMPPALSPPAGGGITPNPWYGGESAIQASSIDLHIGKVLLPNVEDNVSGSVKNPKSEFVLELGHTGEIVTSEQVDLPEDIAAFGFPPSRLSSRGLLMTNPGHIDPGFSGRLRFTVMNIGKENIPLRKGDPIVTLLFFRLSGNAVAGYAQRKGLTGPISEPTQEDVNRLSLDFLDVTARTNEAAKRAIAAAEFRAKYGPPALSALATIIVALVVGFFGYLKPLDEVQMELKQVRQVLELTHDLRSRLDKIDGIDEVRERLGKIEQIFESDDDSNSTRDKQ